jgi:DNA-directed RNA polymerase specialized sigma24 family protein
VNDLDAYLPAITAGDAEAFGAWMAEAEPVLRDRLRCFASRVDTEAVLQETLLRLWQLAPRFDHDGKPNGLLRLGFVVARNLAVSECRRLRSSPVEPQQLAETLGGAEARPPDPLLRKVIQLCRDRLPRQPALALSARLGASGAEPDEALARRLQMRTNTFLQNFGRARKLLLECLRKRGVDLEAELA